MFKSGEVEGFGVGYIYVFADRARAYISWFWIFRVDF